MSTLASAILSARQLVGDAPTSNLVRGEDLNNTDIGNVFDGVTTIFSLTNFPVAPAASGGGVAMVIADGIVLSPTATPPDYVVNEPLGQLTLAVPPSTSLHATYYFYLMDDSAWTEFITNGIERINASTGVPATDIVTVPEGLLVAVKQYAAANWAQRLAGQTGLWYNQRLQERDEQRENISRKFMQLAKQFFDNGDKARDDFYKGSGSQNKAAFTIIRMMPRDWTPRR